jgi:myxalamid-type polyketide synthase MxaE and MxaD
VGVNLLPRGDIFFSSAGALSPDGRCHVFDHRANGIVRSEGAGVVILKPLTRALADGDRIYAVIRGGAVNHDGRSNGIMAPNGLAQEAMLLEAYRKADVSPALVQFVETHGTGTPLGDPIEVKALGNVLGVMRANDQPCLIGSVKTNVGHLESAAGVAAVMKTALAIHHRLIPPNLHFERMNPLIELPEFPMSVPTEVTPWPNPDQSLIAGVSGFSFGGTNVHVVLDEAPRSESATVPMQTDRDTFVLPLSARSPHALSALAQKYRDFLRQKNGEEGLGDICYTAGVRRSHFDYRLAVIGENRDEIATILSAWLDPSHADEPGAGLIVGRGAREGGVRVVFVFSGQGTQCLSRNYHRNRSSTPRTRRMVIA